MNRFLPCSTLIITLCLSPSLHAVVANADGATAYTSDPGTGVPFNNVIRYGAATAVYLGGGWIISASHNGNQSSVDIGSTTHLIDPSFTTMVTQIDRLSGSPDLRLHRLETLPDLDAVTLGGLAVGDIADLIGFGGGPQRGATNNISFIDQDIQTNASGTLITSTAATLDSESSRIATDQAQAQGGDSGGGAFVFDGTNWVLGGILLAIQEDADIGRGQTSNVTFIANLSDYGPQIQEIIDQQGVLTVPEPSTTLLVGLSSLLLLSKRSRPEQG